MIASTSFRKFTRDPAKGDRACYGEFLINAQGEDVVAGIRTPQYLTKAARAESGARAASMEEAMPEVYGELGDRAGRSGGARPAPPDARPAGEARRADEEPARVAGGGVGRGGVRRRHRRTLVGERQGGDPDPDQASPEDIHGMHAAKGHLTARGGMTSHAAVVAGGVGRPCVSRAGSGPESTSRGVKGVSVR